MSRSRSWPVSFLVLLISSSITPLYAQEGFTDMVAMDDGVKLHTEVTLPAGDGPFPVALIRTPYNDNLMEYLQIVTGVGAAVVLQDTRGTGKSEGDADPFFSDRKDGQRTAQWILEQPWCDQRILMGGASALTIPEYLMAPGAPPEVICQTLAIGTPDVYGHGVFHGGAFKETDVVKWLQWTGASHKLEMLNEHRLCDAFWDPVRVQDLGSDVRAAGLHVGGWFDVFSEGTLTGFTMYRQSDDPWVSDHQYLIMGPWSHHGLGGDQAGEIQFPPNASYEVISLALTWLGWCFQGGQTGDPFARVQYYVMGDVNDPDAPGNEWREADDWPVPFDEVPLYLAGDGGLTWEPPTPETDHAFPFPFNPADPSPTKGGRNLTGKAGPYDQADLEARDDAVVFSSAVLAEPIEVTGRVFASLSVSTSGTGGDVAVRLTDVYPDGRSILVTEGIQRMRFRQGCQEESPVVPGEAVRLEVDLWSTSHVFNTGHRIRAVLTGSNHPRYELNPQVAGAINLTVFSSAAEPSFLRLPVPTTAEPTIEVGEDALPEVQLSDYGPEVVSEDGRIEVNVPAETVSDFLVGGDDLTGAGNGGSDCSISLRRPDSRSAGGLLLAIGWVLLYLLGIGRERHLENTDARPL